MPVRLFCSLLLVAALLEASFSLQAENSGAFKTVSWTPQPIASGSPCLLTVVLQDAPTTMEGEWLGRKVEFFPSRNRTTWYALAGADVETAPGTYTLTLHATLADGRTVKDSREIPVSPSHYRQVELHVPENFVTPDAATLKRIVEDKEIKDKAFAQSDALPLWHGNFFPPVNSPATDSFGTRRVFNGRLASIHRGMDFRAASGTPVYAANAGRVLLARNLFYEGNCVVIDHGQQFTTIYMHLSKILVREGETVQPHQLVGSSGATGRATGPHLHFAVRWDGAYLDPAILLRMKLSAAR